MRKIVQIAFPPRWDFSQPNFIFAVCEDGKLWRGDYMDFPIPFVEVSKIPQDEQKGGVKSEVLVKTKEGFEPLNELSAKEKAAKVIEEALEAAKETRAEKLDRMGITEEDIADSIPDKIY